MRPTDIDIIASLIAEDPDTESEEAQLAQMVADTIRDVSREDMPFYPEIETIRARPYVIVKSPEDWPILWLEMNPPQITAFKANPGGSNYMPPWALSDFDLYDPSAFDKIYEACKEQYAKKQKRSPGRLRIPR